MPRTLNCLVDISDNSDVFSRSSRKRAARARWALLVVGTAASVWILLDATTPSEVALGVLALFAALGLVPFLYQRRMDGLAAEVAELLRTSASELEATNGGLKVQPIAALRQRAVEIDLGVRKVAPSLFAIDEALEATTLRYQPDLDVSWLSTGEVVLADREYVGALLDGLVEWARERSADRAVIGMGLINDELLVAMGDDGEAQLTIPPLLVDLISVLKGKLTVVDAQGTTRTVVRIKLASSAKAIGSIPRALAASVTVFALVLLSLPAVAAPGGNGKGNGPPHATTTTIATTTTTIATTTTTQPTTTTTMATTTTTAPTTTTTKAATTTTAKATTTTTAKATTTTTAKATATTKASTTTTVATTATSSDSDSTTIPDQSSSGDELTVGSEEELPAATSKEDSTTTTSTDDTDTSVSESDDSSESPAKESDSAGVAPIDSGSSGTPGSTGSAVAEASGVFQPEVPADSAVNSASVPAPHVVWSALVIAFICAAGILSIDRTRYRGLVASVSGRRYA